MEDEWDGSKDFMAYSGVIIPSNQMSGQELCLCATPRSSLIYPLLLSRGNYSHSTIFHSNGQPSLSVEKILLHNHIPRLIIHSNEEVILIVHPITFENVDAAVIRSAALHTDGSASPSGWSQCPVLLEEVVHIISKGHLMISVTPRLG